MTWIVLLACTSTPDPPAPGPEPEPVLETPLAGIEAEPALVRALERARRRSDSGGAEHTALRAAMGDDELADLVLAGASTSTWSLAGPPDGMACARGPAALTFRQAHHLGLAPLPDALVSTSVAARDGGRGRKKEALLQTAIRSRVKTEPPTEPYEVGELDDPRGDCLFVTGLDSRDDAKTVARAIRGATSGPGWRRMLQLAALDHPTPSVPLADRDPAWQTYAYGLTAQRIARSEARRAENVPQ